MTDVPRDLLRCPVHERTDCSPLLNGCSIPNRLAEAYATGRTHAAIAEKVEVLRPKPGDDLIVAFGDAPANPKMLVDALRERLPEVNFTIVANVVSLIPSTRAMAGLIDARERMTKADQTLLADAEQQRLRTDALRDDGVPSAETARRVSHLRSKAEGVRLARGYVDEVIQRG